MAWSVRDGFEDSERHKELVEQVKTHDPDLAFFSEAVSEPFIYLSWSFKRRLPGS